MNVASIESNPFALLLAPDVVIARVLASEHLAMLNSRICRPLDTPLFGQDQAEGEASDASVDAANPAHD